MSAPPKKKPRRQYGKANDGTKIVSVTTVIGETLGWSKNSLMFWAAREAASEAIRMKNEGLSDEECIRFGKIAHVAKRDAAADAGSTAHAMMEALLTGDDVEDAIDPLLDPDIVDNARRCYGKFVAWWSEKLAAGWSVVDVEVMLVDRAIGVGGTPDLILRAPDGTLVVADLKTGKGVYDEVAIQLAAYAVLYRPVGDIQRGLVVHCPIVGDVVEHDVPTLVMQHMAASFAALLTVHRGRKLINIESGKAA